MPYEHHIYKCRLLKVEAQLVSLITNIETISSTQLTQQTQSILNQINNIRYEKNKSAECRIIVIANPKPDKAIITKISVEEGIPNNIQCPNHVFRY